MDDSRVDSYLERIGATRPGRADAAALAELQLHHLRSVPFENLSIHLDEPIVLEEAALVDKLVQRRRGGFAMSSTAPSRLCCRRSATRCASWRPASMPAAGSGRRSTTSPSCGVEGGGTVGWSTSGSAASATTRCGSTAESTSRTPAGSSCITPTAEGDLDVTMDGQPQYRVETCPGGWPTSSRPAGGTRPRPPPLHPVLDLLDAHRRRPGHQRLDPGRDDRDRTPRAHPDRRRPGAGRLPRPLRHRS